MTIYDNDFHLGVAGANATTASIASSGYGYHVGGATVAKFSAVDAIADALAIEIARTSGSTLQVYTNNALSTLDVSFSVMFTYKSALPGTNDNLWDVVAGGSLVRCFTNSTGHPFVQLSGSTIGTATGAFVADTKYRCDVRVHINASTGSIHCDFYPYNSGTPSFTGFSFTSQNTGSTAITDIFFGPYGANTVASGTFVLGRPRIDNTQSSTYFGPITAAAPTCSAGADQIVNARDSVTLVGVPTWAVGHSGTVAWSGGDNPIASATSNTATVADIGFPALTAGNPIKDDSKTFTFTATQDDAQVATDTMTVTRKCGNRWTLKGTRFVCAPLVRNR